METAKDRLTAMSPGYWTRRERGVDTSFQMRDSLQPSYITLYFYRMKHGSCNTSGVFTGKGKAVTQVFESYIYFRTKGSEMTGLPVRCVSHYLGNPRTPRQKW